MVRQRRAIGGKNRDSVAEQEHLFMKLGNDVMVIGGGLAGSEAAWQIARSGVPVRLYEMRPRRMTPAHVSDRLAELVCSNSLGSVDASRAPGLLKAEMLGLGSLILDAAAQSALPAGASLAVDRERFAELVTERIAADPLITIVREEVTTLPEEPCIIATGPLTSESLAASIAANTGQEYLYFFDALAPIVTADSIDMSVAFRASRYDRGVQDDGDYINCPLNETEYERFHQALVAAETIHLREFERDDARFFEGCLPVEALAKRGQDALRFGPMRPVGLRDPRTGEQPFAVVQLRQDNVAASLYNLVGFQTNLRWGQQAEVLRLIPGLAGAEFVRLGQMHRNTYINSPSLLQPTLQYRSRADLFFAGQITGVEGYVGNAGTGLLAGLNAARLVQGRHPVILPPKTMLGALIHYVTHADARTFQPMKSNFGIVPPLEQRARKAERYRQYSARSLTALRRFAREQGLSYDQARAESAATVWQTGPVAAAPGNPATG